MNLVWTCSTTTNETPAQSVLNYIEQKSDITKLRGGQTTTWLKLFEKDLNETRKHPDDNINQLLWNRSAWRQRCNLIIPDWKVRASLMMMKTSLRQFLYYVHTNLHSVIDVECLNSVINRSKNIISLIIYKSKSVLMFFAHIHNFNYLLSYFKLHDTI